MDFKVKSIYSNCHSVDFESADSQYDTAVYLLSEEDDIDRPLHYFLSMNGFDTESESFNKTLQNLISDGDFSVELLVQTRVCGLSGLGIYKVRVYSYLYLTLTVSGREIPFYYQYSHDPIFQREISKFVLDTFKNSACDFITFSEEISNSIVSTDNYGNLNWYSSTALSN